VSLILQQQRELPKTFLHIPALSEVPSDTCKAKLAASQPKQFSAGS